MIHGGSQNCNDSKSFYDEVSQIKEIIVIKNSKVLSFQTVVVTSDKKNAQLLNKKQKSELLFTNLIKTTTQ